MLAFILFLIIIWISSILSRFVSQKFVVLFAKLNKEDLTKLGEFMQTGKMKPVIDRRYSLPEVPEALRYLEKGHARGKVVITVEPPAA